MLVQQNSVPAPGARIVVRDAEWLVRKVDITTTGDQALTVVGISEIVRDREAIFLTKIEPKIEILDPAETRLVADDSPGYMGTRLYIESLLRQTAPADDRLHIGDRAAMDLNPYQLDPALQALQQPRQRILIADAVGLGKTLEAGILLAELIRRGRGKRILVVTVKSMLTQFQKELWTRFTIALTRLDSVGLQRVRASIPSLHNPFNHFDRAIVSIDTLKNDAEYRVYLEKARWDVIVIDEAHNVAERGTSSSLRAKLAQLLASRSDTLIMLSATPHDGRARSFASLMNMLDPTAIANPDDYAPEDIKGLYIRRFKKHIKDQVQGAFKERKVMTKALAASPTEEAAFEYLADLRFTRLDKAQGTEILYKTTLEKALFSSPRAASATISTRLERLRKTSDDTYAEDIAALEHLKGLVDRIGPADFTRYQALLQVIRDTFRWTPRDKRDRLVVFTERIETLNFLAERLTADLGLRADQIAVLKGTGMSDVEQNEIVEGFGREESPIRLLVASDVASEGINLHFLSHRMVHFDIPWSLMVFQQRNGRIDRYGQEQTPEIVYLETDSRNEKIRGDMRIIELLIRKDKEAVKNIGDPSAFMGVYDVALEEQITARAIEQSQSVEAFDKQLTTIADDDPLAFLMGASPPPTGQAAAQRAKIATLFSDDFTYVRDALGYLGERAPRARVHAGERQVELVLPDVVADGLPREMLASGREIVLSPDPKVMMGEMAEARKGEERWPRVQYLWPLHPLMPWIEDQINATFKRHEAPVIALSGVLAPDEVVFVLSGLVPNRRAHPLVHRWMAATFRGGRFEKMETLDDLLARTKLAHGRHPSQAQSPDEVKALQALLPEAVRQARASMSRERAAFQQQVNDRLAAQVAALKRLRGRQVEQLTLQIASLNVSQTVAEQRRAQRQRQIDQVFDEHQRWIEDTMTTEDSAFIQVVAALRGVK